MNIGIVTVWFQRGAAYVSEQYRNILSENHDVFIYARGGENNNIKEAKWNDKKITRAPKIYSDSWTRINKSHFRNWIKKQNIEIIIFNEQKDWEIVHWCKKNKIITAAYIDYYTRDTIPFFELYDILLCNTKRHYSVFRWHKEARYIPWGTDTNLFKPDKLKTKVPDKEVTFFHSAGMGGINSRKGTDLLVHAFQKVKGGCRLVIQSQVGPEEFGNIKDIIVKDKRIEFIHKTVEPPGMYTIGDIYVYPTRLEGIGLTIVEALSSGLPVVTTNQAPMNEFVEDGVTGKLVDVDMEEYRFDNYYWPESTCSIENLAKNMQSFIDSRDDINIMSLEARKYSTKERNWKNNSYLLNNIIENADLLKIDGERLKYLEKSCMLYTKNILRKKSNRWKLL